jgi:hypothetical protein
MIGIICVVVIILTALWWTGYFADGAAESFGPCYGDCGDERMPYGITMLNPYVWPYSGTVCPDELYFQHEASGSNIGLDQPPLTHLNTPDHVILG